MAYSGTTTHYGLPKYVSTDKPSWLDTNDGFDAIDAALYAAAQAVDPAQIAQMQNDITALQTGKQNILTFDAVPTNGSVNPVTSGGVYDSIAPLKAHTFSGSDAIDISTYIDFGSAYTCPSDGYVRGIEAGSGGGVFINNVNVMNLSSGQRDTIMVRKGMKVHNTLVTPTVSFIPFS